MQLQQTEKIIANQKNREALAAIAKQGDVYALLVTAPDGA